MDTQVPKVLIVYLTKTNNTRKVWKLEFLKNLQFFYVIKTGWNKFGGSVKEKRNQGINYNLKNWKG